MLCLESVKNFFEDASAFLCFQNILFLFCFLRRCTWDESQVSTAFILFRFSTLTKKMYFSTSPICPWRKTLFNKHRYVTSYTVGMLNKNVWYSNGQYVSPVSPVFHTVVTVNKKR